jgi:hypothetical protein
VTGGVGIGEDLYVAGDLYVEGDSVTLNTETLTVEDTLVLAGNGLASEPSTGGFGFEVGPITSPSGVASNVTGAHSIVYNYANDRWEADGSLILSSATLDTPYIEGVAFGPSDDLTFSAGSGLSETVVKTGADIVTTYTNTDKGSSQSIFKTVTINGTAGNNVVADSNSDTLNLRGLDAITLTSVPGTDTISIDHDDFGTAGTYGVTGTQDGQYIKSIITNAQGHVTGVTSADFDTRYQATNPSFEIKVNDVKVDDVFPGDKIDLIEGVGIDIAGSLVGTESNITISHQDTSSVGNLSQNNSGNTFIQDLAFTFDTFGHVTGATASTATVAIGNGTFTVSGSSGLAGSGSMTANQSGNSSAGLTNTDKGSDQNIFKNIVVRNLADTTLGTVVADNNNDTIYLDAGNSGITLSVDAGSDHISINHADTSAASSVNNSGRTYIQDITLDTYGHITAISSATESYVYTPPTYAGDDINIDTGALTGATVISDLDFNITTNTLGHVTDANATVATRNLTLANLGYNGWDLYTEGTKRADINVNGIVNFADDAFLTTTYSSTNNTVSYGHPTSPLNGTYGGNNNGIVIEDITVDTRGHITSIGTRDLDGRFDNYGSWNIGDGSTTSAVTAGNTVHIIGGSNISTTRSGDNVTVAFVDPGYLTSQRNATLDVQGNSTNPYIRLTDASADHVQVVGSGTVTVTGSESLDRITIHGTDTNTDINVNDANLRARLAGLNPAQGVAYIGDSGNDLDLRIRGNLTVEGTQTIMNTETVTTHDNAILLNSNATATPTEDGGVELERGNLNNARVFWNEASDRWQHGIVGTMYNIPLPSEADITSFVVRDDSNSTATITRNEVLAIDGGTAIGTNFIAVNSGESHRLEIAHSNVGKTETTLASTTLGSGGAFSVVSGIGVNAQGHVTQINTKPFTLPASDNYGSWTAKDHDGSVYTITSGDTLQYKEGGGMDVNFTADDVLTFTNTMYANNTAIGGDSRNTRGVTRLYRRDANSDFSVQTNWTGTYWQLEGYTGDAYHAPVRVEKSELSDAALTLTTSGLSNDYDGNGSVQSADALLQAKGKKSGTPQISVTGAAGTGIYLRSNRVLTEAVGLTDTIGSLTIGTSAGSTYHTNATTYDGTNITHYVPSAISTGVYNVYAANGTGTITNLFSIAGSTGNITVKSGATIDGVDVSALQTQVNGITSDTGTPAIKSNGSTPSLNTGITAAEIRSLIGAGTGNATVNDTGIPALLGTSGNVTLNTGITAAEVRTAIGAGTATVDDTGTPAILSDGATPTLNSGITAAEIRLLIGAGTGNATVNDTGVPAMLSNGSTPTLNSGISAAEIRSLIGAGTVSFDAMYGYNNGSGGGYDFSSGSIASGGSMYFDASGGVQIGQTTNFGGTGKHAMTISLDYDQRLAYSSGTHVKVGHAGTNGKSYLDFNVSTSTGDPGYIDVYTAASGLSAEALNFRFDGDGDFHADGDIIAYSTTTASDAKLKTNIKTVENALDKVCQLDGVTFDWIRDGKESAGVIAQNVEEVLPRAVKEVEDLKGDDSHKVVDYNQLSALFIEAIKELKEENKSLRAEIESLKDINS